jgi:hypothetical protein
MGIKFLDEQESPQESSGNIRFIEPAPTAPVAAQAPAETSTMGEFGRQLGLTARAGITGLSAVPNAVADFLSGAANLGLQAAGSEQRVPYLSQLQQQAIERTFPTPRPGLEQNVQTAAGAVAGLMTPGMGATMSPQQTAADTLRRGLSEAAATATGAVAGEEASKKTGEYFGPWAGLAAGLATGTITGSAVGKGLYSLTSPRTEPVTIESIRQRASQGYQTMEDAKLAVNSDSIKNKLIPRVMSTLKSENYDPQIVKAHGAIEDNLNLLNKLVSEPTVDFTRLEKVRGVFSSMSQGKDDVSRLAKSVTGEIDSYLASLSGKDVYSAAGKNTQETLDTLYKARTDWRNQARAQVIQDILDSATARIEGATGPTGDIIKRNLVNLTANVDKMKMFSTREQNVIKAAAKSTDLETLLSIMSKFNPERGYAQSAVTGSALTSALLGQGPVTAAGMGYLGASGAGYLADKALASTRQKAVEGLISQIASGRLQPPKEGFAVPGLFGAIQGQ